MGALEQILGFLLLTVRLWAAYLKAFYRLFVSPSKVSVLGKVVLITGGGSGLGREMAMRLAAEGARLVLWDISEKGNKETAEMIQSAVPGAEVHLYTVDVTNKELVKTSAARVQSEVGRVYMLINNAGVLVGEAILDLKDSDIRRTFEINTISVFWMLRAFLPSMLEANSGHLVTTCSTAGQNGAHRMTDYCASKFAIYGLDESLDAEIHDVYRKSGVKQTLVCPHMLNTGLIHAVEQSFGPGMQDVSEAADAIVDGILRKKRYIYFPELYRFVPTLKQLVPYEGMHAMADFVKVQVPSQEATRPHKD